MMFLDGLLWKVLRMKKGARGGISFAGLMFLLFLGLKLGGVVNWSWWFVTFPLWGPVALFFGILILLAVLGGVVWYWRHD